MQKAGQLQQEIEELEKKQEWWWAAEKKRSKRLDYLRKAVWKKGAIGGVYNPGVKIDLEFARLYTDAYFSDEAKHDGQMMRKAKTLAYVMDNMPIFITDQAQLVGYVGTAPHRMLWRVDAASMINEEVYNEPGIHEEPEEESLREATEICARWAGEGAVDKLARLLDPEDTVKFMSGAIGWGTPTSALGYANKDYEYIMTGKRGFEDIIREIDQRMEEAEEKTVGIPGPEILPLYKKIQNWDAMKVVLEAAIRSANR